MSFSTLTAMTQESFDRIDYDSAFILANQLFPVHQTETLNNDADNMMIIIIGAVVGVIVLLTLLSVITVTIVSFVFYRRFK